MNYTIEINDKYGISHVYNSNTYIVTIPNINLLLEKDYLDILLEKSIKQDDMINLIHLPDDILNYVVKAVKENISDQEIINFLTKNNVILFSLVLNTINLYKEKYWDMKLSCLEKIMMDGNKENLLDIFKLSNKLNIQFLIDLSSISLQEYYELVKDYDLEELKKLDILIHFQEFNETLTPFELYETSLLVATVAEDIQKYNLSLIEQITYVYDMVKRRKYQKDKDNSMKCRNLKSVLENDDIVCLGYVNIFNAILRCLNINCIGLLSNGHIRSMVYVKDDKYNVDGVYVFDPTWDSKKKENQDYINNYKYFMMSTSTATKYLSSSDLELLSLDYSDIMKLRNNLDKETISKLDKIDELFSLINIEKITDVDYGIYNYNEIERLYNSGKEKYQKEEIDYEQLFQILYSVRRIEYYNGMIDNIDIDNIIKGVFKKYFELKYNKKSIPPEFYMLMESLFRATIEADWLLDNENTSIERDTLNIHLVKTLKRIKNKKEVDNN